MSARTVGVMVSADGLANLEIGLLAGRAVAIKFRAEKTANITAARIVLRFGGAYSAGTGGQVKCELQTEFNNVPSGTVLATDTIVDPLTGGSYRDFSLSANLSVGTPYYLVFTNPDADPVANYVSLNNLDNAIEQEVTPCGSIVWKFDSGSAWATNVNHTPIFELTYADSSTQGQGYTDARSESGLVGLDTPRVEAITPTVTYYVSRVGVRVRDEGATNNLSISLNGVTVTVPPANVPATNAWVWVDLATTLNASTTYNLTLSGDVLYKVFPVVQGSNNGFGAETYFSEGNYGGGNEDLQVRLLLQDSPGAAFMPRRTKSGRAGSW